MAMSQPVIKAKDNTQTDVLKELDFGNIPCKLHKEQPCCRYCSSCEKLVCPTCVADIHAGHIFTEIKASYTEILNKLGGALSKLYEQENELKERNDEENQYRKEKREMYSKVKKEIKTQRETYRNDIDKYFDTLDNKVEQKKNEMIKSQEEKNEFSKTKKRIDKKKTKIETLMSTRNAAEFFNSASIFLADAKVTLPVSSLQRSEKLLKFVPKYENLTEEVLGILKEEEKRQVIKKNLDLRIKNEYTTNLDRCHLITACSDGSYFIAQTIENNVITKIQIQTDNTKTIFTKKLPNICDIDNTQADRDILLADGTPTVKVMNGSTGDIAESQYRTESLDIIAVHVTMDNKVVVGARSPGDAFPVQGRRVVIVMDSKGKHQTEWEYNQRRDRRLFSYPIPAVSTRNETTFVRDVLSNDRGQVITLSPTGDVLNTYTGHPNKQTPFTPAGMTRTPSDNVIVCDFSNNALHLLNNAGVPLSYFSTTGLGIQCPHCVIFDTKDSDTLYIGCTRRKGCTEKSKLYRVHCTEVE